VSVIFTFLQSGVATFSMQMFFVLGVYDVGPNSDVSSGGAFHTSPAEILSLASF
jgi:hypothetical protein